MCHGTKEGVEGRIKNKKTDSRNETVSFGQALKDVDVLVEYLCNRFCKEQVVIMGHLYGALCTRF